MHSTLYIAHKVRDPSWHRGAHVKDQDLIYLRHDKKTATEQRPGQKLISAEIYVR